MKPRLTTSKKWTDFPKEYTAQIINAFNQNFAAQLAGAKLIVEGRIYKEEILLRVGFQEKGRLAQPNFEVSMSYAFKESEALARIHDCIDAAASMMDEYFQTDGETDFPRSWKEYEFNGRKVFLQFSTVNTSLEAEADKLLGIGADSFYQEDEDTEDALDVADEKIASEDDEDQEDDETEYETEEDSEDDSNEGSGKKTLH